MAKVKVIIVLVILLIPLWSLKCYSSNPKLLSMCESVAPKVEKLWGKVDAIVYLKDGLTNATIGSYHSNNFTIVLNDPDYCTVAHELTHVIQLYKGIKGPRWFLEGQADLSCYLLYPNEYGKRGYITWLREGFGELDPYRFGITILYYLFKKKGNVYLALNFSHEDALLYFVKALRSCTTPFDICPGPLSVDVSGNGTWWANTDKVKGNVTVIDGIAIFHGYGEAYAIPSPALISVILTSLRRRRTS
ncbi:hypothetical protein IPA_09360 [Ignicoccus pacificus DSM 13166]|uniref:Uncharacterized protein n=1 Tax=Ignicoccus pacificus DSM 13166 TaxID=940294 RepID=A0A977KDH6_9CREN|nr:hypothetical protein IPA_09360 [Ignicoccus pacificus DSM 13166]